VLYFAQLSLLPAAGKKMNMALNVGYSVRVAWLIVALICMLAAYIVGANVLMVT